MFMKNRAVMLAFIFSFAPLSWASTGKAFHHLPVQDGGRLKPFQTFAQESLQLIYGKRSYKGKDATDIVTTWMILPEAWENTEIVEVRHSGLRKALNLDAKKVLFAPADLLGHQRLPLLIQELEITRQRKKKLSSYDQSIQRLQNQLSLFSAIRTGLAVRLAPQANTETWSSVNEMKGELATSFGELIETYVSTMAAVAKMEGADPTGAGEPVNFEGLQVAVVAFIEMARAQAPEKYADMTKIRAEVHYNNLKPFKWGWILYLIGALFLFASWLTSKSWVVRAAWSFLILGFAFHTYGMALRIYLTGRPPVSNMYETVIWVPWGGLVIASVLSWLKSTRLLILGASVVAILCLILSDLSPTVLDPSLQPLEAVLRSTFWLTTHVLIITLSYAAFFLAFILGDFLLFFYWRDEKHYASQIREGVQAIYRCIQVGVVLLAGGVILGGIWADYSWGRFWGWDPKETWALIALLGYVAILHGRLVGWIRQFGMAAGAVVAFSLVIMAWYGVNFVLGEGLHSYGFGGGGVEYVALFVGLHLIYVVFVAAVRKSRKSLPSN